VCSTAVDHPQGTSVLSSLCVSRPCTQPPTARLGNKTQLEQTAIFSYTERFRPAADQAGENEQTGL